MLYLDWMENKKTFNQRMNEVLGFSVESYNQLNKLYGQIARFGTAAAFLGDLVRRPQYDSLVGQFNSVYSESLKKRDADAAAYAQRMAELEQQRQAAEAAAARAKTWASNMNMQNRQDENIPETVTSGTANESASTSGDGAVGDDKRRRGRGSLSSNLGLNV